MPDQKHFIDPHHHVTTASFISSLVASFLSKAVSTTITAPLHFIQTRYQVMTEMKKNGLINKNYTSYTDCISTSIKQQLGIKTLWKGNLAKIIMGWTGIMFSLYAGDLGKKLFSQFTKTSSSPSFLNSTYFGNLAGMITSLGSILITYPFEYAYVRLVTDKHKVLKNESKNFSGIRNVISSTFESDGIRGLYRGVFTSFGGIALYRVSYFGLYDLWKSLSTSPHSLSETFLYSYLITLASSAVAYPFNTIRKRMMMRSMQVQKYVWSGECFLRMVREQGLMSLYRGYPMAIISAIFGSFVLMFYDNLRSKLIHIRD